EREDAGAPPGAGPATREAHGGREAVRVDGHALGRVGQDVQARRRELRAHAHRPERDALEVVAEEVAVLLGIGPPDLGEGLVRNERGVAAVLVAVVEEDDPPSGRDQRRGGIHAPRARADDEDVGHTRERTAAAYTTAPSAARAAATVPCATRADRKGVV